MISNSQYTERFYEYLKNNGYTDENGTLIPSVPKDCLAIFEQFPKIEVTEDLIIDFYDMFKTENMFKEIGAETEELFTWYLKKTLQQASVTYIPKINIFLEKFNSALLDRKIQLKSNETNTYNLEWTNAEESTDNYDLTTADDSSKTDTYNLTDTNDIDRTTEFGHKIATIIDETEQYQNVKIKETNYKQDGYDTTDTTTTGNKTSVTDYLNPTVATDGTAFTGIDDNQTITVGGVANNVGVVQGSSLNSGEGKSTLEKGGTVTTNSENERTQNGSVKNDGKNSETHSGKDTSTEDVKFTRTGTVSNVGGNTRTQTGTKGNTASGSRDQTGSTTNTASRESAYSWFKSNPELLEQVMNLKNIYIDCLHYFDKLFMYVL